MTRLIHGDVTREIIGAALEVHKGLGAGFLETIYEEAMAHELRLRGLSLRRQIDVPIYYRSRLVGEHRLDLLVEEKVIVELKAIKELAEIHTSIVLSYLAATRLSVALLFNFGETSLKYIRVARSQ